MCGINGYAAPSGPIDLRLVEAMNAGLHHRGPDEGGALDVGFAGLGMRRLSIVDLAGGSQPMTSTSERYSLVYNGELYDFAEERETLRARGATFRTASDTEVVLEAWARDGEACLERFNGMFAFAVADREARELVLVRDQVGIKPLFYWSGPRGELVFSSELASLLAHPAVPRRLDRRSLAMLLVDRCVSDPWTMLEGVQQLPPGHLLRWRDGKARVERYGRFLPRPEPRREAEALGELRDLLRESVSSQMVADVPVGVFLSGGIDSSTVAAFAARASEGPLHSFNVAYANADYDESSIAREVAAHLGTEHHEIRVEDSAFDLEILDRVVDHVGQPLGDLSCIPTWMVSRFAREEVKVILSGDGGDELFGGYDHMFWAAKVRRVSERAPSLVRRAGAAVLAGVAPLVPQAVAEPTRRVRKGLELTFREPLDQLRRLMALWTPEEAAELLGERDELFLRQSFLGDPADLEHLSPEEFTMAVLAQTYMTSAILTKVDRMSMAASLEVRVPLLDQRVVRFAETLPLDLKVRGRTGKYLLREAGRDALPGVVYDHPKKGFGLPIAEWFNGEFWDLLEALYAPGSAAASLFDERALRETLALGRNARARGTLASGQAVASRLWLLAQLGRWMERFEVKA